MGRMRLSNRDCPRDIRSSFGGATGVAQGIPLTVKLTVLDLSRSGAAYSVRHLPLHCDRAASIQCMASRFR